MTRNVYEALRRRGLKGPGIKIMNSLRRKSPEADRTTLNTRPFSPGYNDQKHLQPIDISEWVKKVASLLGAGLGQKESMPGEGSGGSVGVSVRTDGEAGAGGVPNLMKGGGRIKRTINK